MRIFARSRGRIYSTGAMPRESAVGEWLPVWDGSEKCPIIPPDQWVTQPSKRHLAEIDVNQNPYPACCLAATANAIHLTQKENGRPVTPCDWYKAWSSLAASRRSGVAIDVALQYIMSRGMPLLDGSGVVKIVEAWDTNDVDAFFSGLQKGCIGIFGADGHAECAASVRVDQVAGSRQVSWVEVENEGDFAESGYAESDSLWADTLNSWGWDWQGGVKGWHLTSREKLARGLPSYGAYLIRGIEIVNTTMPDAKG